MPSVGYRKPSPAMMDEYLRMGVRDPAIILGVKNEWTQAEKEEWANTFRSEIRPAEQRARDEDRRRRQAYREQVRLAAEARAVGERPVLARDIAQGIRGGVADIASLTARPFAPDAADMVTRTMQREEQAHAIAEKGGVIPDILQRGLRGATRSLTQASLLSPLGPYGIIAGFGLSRGNQAITEANDAGLTGKKKWGYVGRAAAIEGGIAAAFQLVGAGGLEKVLGGGQQLTRAGLKEVLKQTGVAMLQELPEENLTEILDQYNQAAAGLGEGVTWESALDIIKNTTIQTAMAVGFASGYRGIGAQEALRNQDALAKDLAQSFGIPEARVREAIQNSAKAKDFDAALGRKLEEESLKADLGVALWARRNREQAGELRDIEAPSRKDFTSRGLPALQNATERRQFVDRLREIAEATETPPEEIPAPEAVQEPTGAAPEEVVQEPTEGVERRVDLAFRKRVEEMTPEERKVALLTSERVPGMPNKRAWDEGETNGVHHVSGDEFQQRNEVRDDFGSYDIDDFKTEINDKLGHEAGNKIIEFVGNALAEAQTESTVETAEAARKILAETKAEVVDTEGKVHSLTIGFSYGAGKTEGEAEAALQRDKRQRKLLGERRGARDVPGGVLGEGEARGQVDDRREVDRGEEVEVPPAVTTETVSQAFPGSTVEARPEADGWSVTLPDGRNVEVRAEADIPVDVSAVMRAYDISEAEAQEMARAGVAGAVIPPGVSMELSDGRVITPSEITVLIDPKNANERTIRHEALHVARQLGLFETKEGRRIWESLEEEYGTEEGIAEAREEWDKPEGLWPRIRQFFQRLFSRFGIQLDPEAAVAETFSERFWGQAAEAAGREPQYSLVGERLEDEQRPEPIATTSIKNEVVNELRRLRGQGELEGVDPESQQEWLNAASDTLSSDPAAGERLVNELIKVARNLSDREVAVLQMYYRSANNEFERLSDELFEATKAGDETKAATAQAAVIEQMAILGKIEEATKAAGREWGRAGVARQISLAKDFSLAGMVRRARVAKGGQELTTDEHAQISKMARQIKDLEKRLAQKSAQIDDVDRKATIDKQLEQDVAQSKKRRVYKKKQKLETRQKDALAKVRTAWEALGNSFVEKPGPPPPGVRYQIAREGAPAAAPEPVAASKELGTAAAEMAQVYVDMGVTNFREFWSIARQYLGQNAVQAEAVFRSAWDTASEAAGPGPELDMVDVTGISREARQIQRRLVEAGLRDRDQIVDIVHASLQDSLPELTRRQAMDALSMYGQFSPLSKEEVDQVVRDINGQLQQLAKLKDMEAGEAPKKTGRERRTPSEEERHLIQQVNEAKKRGGFEVTDPETQLRSALDAAKRATRNRIADLAWEIEKRERIVRKTSELEADSELKALRAERDALLEAHREIFPPKKKPLTREQRIAAANRALDRAITDLEKRLGEGDISPKAKPAPLSTPELNAKRARLGALRAQRDALRAAANPKMTPEERARRAYESNLKRRIADYQERIAQKEFQPRKKEPRQLSASELRLKRRLEDVKSQFYEAAAKWHLENLSPIGRAGDILRETAHLSRAAMTAIDLSGVLRQGALAVYSHPMLAKKAAAEMMKALVSKQAEFNSAERIRNDPLGQFAETAGLSITSDDGPISRQEEAFMGRWAKKVPGIAASGRAYTTFLNNMRFGLFKLMVDKLGRSGQVTLDEAKVIAKYINVATGRSSNFRIFGLSAADVNTVFFAPRYVASRFQYLAMPFYLPFMKTSLRVKKAIAAEYARTFSGAAVFIGSLMALGYLAADDDDDEPVFETDPRSANFLKIRIGETRIDPMGGLSQTIVVAARIAPRFLGGGRIKTAEGKIKELGEKGQKYKPTTRWTIAGRFLRTKLAPVPGAGVTALNDMINVVGEKETMASLSGQLFLPLSLRDVKDSMQAHGVAKGTAVSILAIFGAGVQTYGPKTSYLDATGEEREKIFKRDLKQIMWDDPPLAYSEFLDAEQLKKVDEARRYDVGKLITAATDNEPTKKGKTAEEYEEAVKKWTNARTNALKRLSGAREEQAIDDFRLYWRKKQGYKVGSEAWQARFRALKKLGLKKTK